MRKKVTHMLFYRGRYVLPLLSAGIIAGTSLFVPSLIIFALLAFGYLFSKVLNSSTKFSSFIYGGVFSLGYYSASLSAFIYTISYKFPEVVVGKIAIPIIVLFLVFLIFGLLMVGAKYLFRSNLLQNIIIFSGSWSAGLWLINFICAAHFSPACMWGISNEILQSLSFIGSWGLSFLTILLGATLYSVGAMPLNLKDRVIAGGLIGIFPLLYLGGSYRLANAPSDWQEGPRLRLVQTNFIYEQTPDLENIISRMAALSSPLPADIPYVVWPEDTIPTSWIKGVDPGFQGRHHFMKEISKLAPKEGLVIFGIYRGVLKNPSLNIHQLRFPAQDFKEYHTSMLMLNAQTDVINYYDKINLLVVGEYLPGYELLAYLKQFYLLKQLINIKVPYLMPGALRPVTHLPKLPAFSPLICYEAMLPGQVISPGPRPEWLLLISNDYWFSDTWGYATYALDQIFEQSRFRAIEEGMPILRSANAGISGVIDSYGRVLQSLPRKTFGVIDTKIPKPLPRLTLYARYKDWPAFVLMLFIGIVVWGATTLGRKHSTLSPLK